VTKNEPKRTQIDVAGTPNPKQRRWRQGVQRIKKHGLAIARAFLKIFSGGRPRILRGRPSKVLSLALSHPWYQLHPINSIYAPAGGTVHIKYRHLRPICEIVSSQARGNCGFSGFLMDIFGYRKNIFSPCGLDQTAHKPFIERQLHNNAL
jgi:hypothetical protein